LKLENWLRNFERSWYILVASSCEETCYIPVNALNYLHETAQSTLPIGINPYYEMMFLERELDIVKCDAKTANATFCTLIKTFRKFHDLIKEEEEFNLHKLLKSMFNMIATLATNFSDISSDLVNQILAVIDMVNDCEYFDEENASKFKDYYGGRNEILNFQAEFHEISDEEKNDALYYDCHQDAFNQYFVALKLAPVSEDPSQKCLESYQNYSSTKKIKIMAHRRLAKRMQKLLKNVLLARKTNLNTGSNLKLKLPLSLTDWIYKGEEQYVAPLINFAAKNYDFVEVVCKVEETMVVLFNIFNSHYTIKNSFDTHFITDHIRNLDKVARETRQKITEKFSELSNSKADDSFNPFIEVSAQEETKFVDVNQAVLENQIKRLIEPLKTAQEYITLDLSQWMAKKSSPELLNLQTQQFNLKQKLKWEKMYNSKDKLLHLRKIMKGIRGRKTRK
jgi:hypothetical protein